MYCKYRDPVTGLAIVPPEMIDPEARDAFCRLLLLPPLPNTAAEGLIHVIVFYARIARYTRYNKSVSRYLLLSRNYWYVCKPTGQVSRCCRINRIAKVIFCRDNCVVWKIAEGRDVVMRLDNAEEIAFLTNVLRILYAHNTGKPSSLLSVVKRGEVEPTKLSTSELPQLKGGGSDDEFRPLPLVSVAEAQRYYTVDEAVVLMPPPPPRSLLCVFDADNGSVQDSGVDAVIKYLCGDDTSLAPAASLASSTIAGGDDNESKNFNGGVESVVQRKNRISRTTQTAASTIHRIWPVKCDSVAVTSETPLPPVLRSAPASSPIPAQQNRHQTPRPPPPQLPPGFFGSLPTESGGMSAEHIMMQELRGPKNRLISVERYDELSEQFQSTNRDVGSSVLRQRFDDKSEAENTPRSLPPSLFIRKDLSQRNPLCCEKMGPSAADFALSIMTETLERRLELRRCEIDKKLQLTSSYISGGDTQHLPLVTRLQEELLSLLQAQRADEQQFVEKQEREVHVGDILPSAEGEVNCGAIERKSYNDTDSTCYCNSEEKKLDGVQEDYDMWVLTDEGKEWYKDNFAKHLAACKMLIVHRLLERSTMLF